MMFEGNALLALIERLRARFVTRDGTDSPLLAGARVGDGNNFTDIDRDGTIALVGTATAWEDLRIEPVARTAGNHAPTFEQYFSTGSGSIGVYLYSFDNAVVADEKEIFFTAQMPHAWAGSTVSPHLHWVPATAGASKAVRWGFEYTWQGIGEVFGATTIIYSTTTTSGDTSLVAGKHYITEFADLTPNTFQRGISSILIGRVFRNSSHADDTYTGKCGALYIDIHVEIDSFGSDTEYNKLSVLTDDAGVPLTDNAGRVLKESA